MQDKVNHFNFTEKALLDLPIPSQITTYYDTGSTAGLCVIITPQGTKTYYSYIKVRGTPIRTKIGRVGSNKRIEENQHTIRLIEAREEASRIKAKSTDIVNLKARNMTLKEFFITHYKPRHLENLILDKTYQDKCKDLFRDYLPPLYNTTLTNITNLEVEELLKKIAKDGKLPTANRVLSLISKIYTCAINWKFISVNDNPTKGIKKFPEKSRDRFLQPDELVRFWKALDEEPNIKFKNYVELSLFTGQRRSNILSIKWEQIDFENKLIYFPTTKNGEAQYIPLTTQALELLKEMYQNKTSEFLFPSKTSKSGHYVEPKRDWAIFLERANISNLRLQDLRRSQASYQSIKGSSETIVGKSLGHKSTISTQVYTRLNLDTVRDSMQKANDAMCEFKNNLKPQGDTDDEI